jgi:hypothetical protein
MRIEIYNPSFKSQWDDFVRASKNGTFLFLRDYMDYHSDRFADNSLVVFDNKGQLLALLPANKKDAALISHGGLTYGGFVTDERMKTSVMLEIFERALLFLKENGFAKLIYKTVPHIYHSQPAEEDLYALFRFYAVLTRRDAASTIVLPNKIRYQERRNRAVKKAQTNKITCRISEDYAGYWQILTENLTNVHGVEPVHNLSEIEMLRALFPGNIKLYAAYLDNEMIAGTVIYETAQVAHAQYIASSSAGRALGGLDLLFHCLITEIYNEKSFFDFGIATENQGTDLNVGLMEFKEGFGGRAVAYDFYEINLEL